MNLAITHLCSKVGMTPQNYHKTRKKREYQKVNEQFICDLVRREREVQPRIGSLKLYYVLKEELSSSGVKVGRDKMLGILKSNGLTLKRLKKAPYTTNSYHTLPVFNNVIKDMTLTDPNQVWVSDITYIRLNDGFVYLSLVTDKYSRKIVGWALSKTLTAGDTLNALRMALDDLPKGATPIHHSDRGIQYCSHEYVKTLTDAGLGISMTEKDHCAENALAERLNGILKQEYYLKHRFKSFAQAHSAVKEAIGLYNNRRLHRALGLVTPVSVHRPAA